MELLGVMLEKGKFMTKEIELAKQHGIQYRLTPEGTTEMWCHDRDVQAFADAIAAAERARCIDCRLCAKFTVGSGCISTAKCIDGSEFKPTAPRRYWVTPNVGIEPRR